MEKSSQIYTPGMPVFYLKNFKRRLKNSYQNIYKLYTYNFSIVLVFKLTCSNTRLRKKIYYQKIKKIIRTNIQYFSRKVA